MMIGEKTKAEAQAMLQSLFKDHWTEIKEAYTKSDETGLTVFFSVALKERDGLVHLKNNISFISDRVKDELTLDINEKQQEFPGMKKEKPFGETVWYN